MILALIASSQAKCFPDVCKTPTPAGPVSLPYGKPASGPEVVGNPRSQ